MRDTKGKEYAHSEDRFANFNRLSDEVGLKNYQIGYVYLKKHLDSIASFMKEGKTFSSEGIRGRFVDAIVYLTLIAGMVEEQIKYMPNVGSIIMCSGYKHKVIRIENDIIVAMSLDNDSESCFYMSDLDE